MTGSGVDRFWADSSTSTRRQPETAGQAPWPRSGTPHAPVGLHLAPDKTRVAHIDEGFDFLGFHIRRMHKRGTQKRYVYTIPVPEGHQVDHGQGVDQDPQVNPAPG